MEWFRLYHSVLDDPKVQRLRPETFKNWINFLCISSRQTDRGSLPPIEEIAFSLRETEAKTRKIFAELVAAGLIDQSENDRESGRIHGWNRRQKRSDNVAERVANHREKQDSNVTGNVTGNVTSNDDETFSRSRKRQIQRDTETETEEREPPVVPRRGRSKRGLDGFSEWYEMYPKKVGIGSAENAWRKMSDENRVAAMDGLRKQLPGLKQREKQYLAAPSRWLNERRWLDEPPPQLNSLGLPMQSAEEEREHLRRTDPVYAKLLEGL